MNLILNWDDGKETNKTVLYSSSDSEGLNSVLTSYNED